MEGLYQQLLLAMHDVRRRRWLALAVAAVICLLGWGHASTFPNRYESEARVFVQMRTILPEKIGMSAQARQKDVDRVKRTLTSTVNLEKVIRATDLVNLIGEDKQITQAAEDLRKKIEVVEQHENLFKISASVGFRGLSDAENARMSRTIVQKMIDIFVEDNLSGDRAETSQSLAFLDKQISALQEQMRVAETRRAEFEKATFGSIPGSGSVQDRIEQARKDLSEIDTDLLSAQTTLVGLTSQMSDSPASLPPNGGTAAAYNPVAIAQAQLNDALGRGWTENHPDIIALRQQLARAKMTAPPMGSGGANPVYGSLRALAAERRATVTSLTLRKRALEAEIARFTATIATKPDVAAEQERLTRDFDATRDQYAALLEKRESVRLQEQVVQSTDTVSFRVIDPPSTPRGAVLPDRPQILLAIGILASIAGVMAALAKSRIQTTFASKERLADVTGMLVIAAVPEVSSRASDTASRRDRRLYFAAMGALAALFLILVVLDQIQRSGLA